MNREFKTDDLVEVKSSRFGNVTGTIQIIDNITNSYMTIYHIKQDNGDTIRATSDNMKLKRDYTETSKDDIINKVVSKNYKIHYKSIDDLIYKTPIDRCKIYTIQGTVINFNPPHDVVIDSKKKGFVVIPYKSILYMTES